MARPQDWEARALQWFRSLEGDTPKAVILAMGGPEDPRAQVFARLMVDCREKSQVEAAAEAFQNEGIPLIKELYDRFTK
jgi:hypothetical protein